MLRSLFVVSLAVTLCLTGCTTSTKPRTLMSLSAGQEPRVRRAPYDGEYRLYAASTDERRQRGPSGEPLATRQLFRREPIGFRVERGELTAVAGGARVPLQRGRPYLWQMRAEPGQADTAKMGAGTVLVATVAFMVMMGTLLF